MRYSNLKDLRLPTHDLPMRPSFLLVLLQRPSIRHRKTCLPTPYNTLMRIHIPQQNNPIPYMLHKSSNNIQRKLDHKIFIQLLISNILSIMASSSSRRIYITTSNVLYDAKKKKKLWICIID